MKKYIESTKVVDDILKSKRELNNTEEEEKELVLISKK